MAEINENYIKFGYINEAEIQKYIQDESLGKYNVCFTKDTKRIFIINGNLEPIALKSRVSIFNSINEAETSINSDSSTYNGEIVSIKNGNVFEAYIVCSNDDGTKYVKAVYEETDLDYNLLKNVPIKNLSGNYNINNLADGTYKLSGVITLPDGSIVETDNNIFAIIDNNDVTIITSQNIVKYVDTHKQTYITDLFLENKGYATTNYVDASIEALNAVIDEKIAEYVDTHVEYLVHHVVNEELDKRELETYIFYGGSAKEVLNYE